MSISFILYIIQIKFWNEKKQIEYDEKIVNWNKVNNTNRILWIIYVFIVLFCYSWLSKSTFFMCIFKEMRDSIIEAPILYLWTFLEHKKGIEKLLCDVERYQNLKLSVLCVVHNPVSVYHTSRTWNYFLCLVRK